MKKALLIATLTFALSFLVSYNAMAHDDTVEFADRIHQDKFNMMNVWRNMDTSWFMILGMK